MTGNPTDVAGGRPLLTEPTPGSVNGTDFLAWQLGFGPLYFDTDLTDSEDAYGGTAAAAHLSFDNDANVDGTDLRTWQRGLARRAVPRVFAIECKVDDRPSTIAAL